MLKLEELEVYNMAMEIGDEVWEVTEAWNYKASSTIGNQLIRAVDSIAANIAEGYGRFHYKENKQFCYYARGSIMETKTFLVKSLKRGLITQDGFNKTMNKLELLHIKLNSYIKSIGNKTNNTGDPQ